MVCKKCGAGIRENCKYCEVCGSKADVESPLIMVETEYDKNLRQTQKSNYSKIILVAALILIIAFIIFLILRN